MAPLPAASATPLGLKAEGSLQRGSSQASELPAHVSARSDPSCLIRPTLHADHNRRDEKHSITGQRTSRKYCESRVAVYTSLLWRKEAPLQESLRLPAVRIMPSARSRSESRNPETPRKTSIEVHGCLNGKTDPCFSSKGRNCA